MSDLAVADLSHIPVSPVLSATLARASEGARATGASEVSLEHLLAALCDDEDAVDVLAASSIEAARLKADVIAYLAEHQSAGPAPAASVSVSANLVRILEAAAAAARGGRRRDINGAIVLAAIVGDGRSTAAGVLQNHGLTFEGAIRALQSAMAQPRGPDVPAAEDVLARARERVQSRSAPSLRDLLHDRHPAQPQLPSPQYTDIVPAADGAQWEPAYPVPAPPPTPVAGKEAEAAAQTPSPQLEPSAPSAATVPAPATVTEPQPAAPPPVHAGATAPASPAPVPSPGPSPDTESGAQPIQPQWEPVAPAPGPPAPAQPVPSTALPVNPGPPAAPARPPFPPQPDAAALGVPPYPPFPAAPLPQQEQAALPPMPQAPASFPGYGPPPAPSAAANPSPASMPQPGIFDRPRTGPQPPPIPPASPRAPPAPPGARQAAPNPYGAPPSVRAPQGPLAPATPQLGRGPAATASVREPRPAAAAEIGQLAENIPRVMRTGVTERIEVRIGRAQIEGIATGMDGVGPAWRHDVTVTKAMSVRIRAPEGGFFIETASPETQWIDSQLGDAGDDFASWRFLVTPQRRGWSELQIIVSARTVGGDGLAAETALPDQVIEIKVRANYGRALLKGLGWVLAAIIGGGLAKFGEGAWALGSGLVQRLMS